MYILNVNGNEYDVAFIQGWVDLGYEYVKGRTYTQPVTTCVFRPHGKLQYYFGVTVCNPHDYINSQRGKEIAFRRAIKPFVDNEYPQLEFETPSFHNHREHVRKELRKSLGKALYKAMKNDQ